MPLTTTKKLDFGVYFINSLQSSFSVLIENFRINTELVSITTSGILAETIFERRYSPFSIAFFL